MWYPGKKPARNAQMIDNHIQRFGPQEAMIILTINETKATKQSNIGEKMQFIICYSLDFIISNHVTPLIPSKL